MRTRLLIAAIVLGSACSGVKAGDKVYSWNDLMLVTSYVAKDTCSCLFVMGQTETYCRAWTTADPDVAHWTADMRKKSVEATAAIFWGARAHYVNAQQGCILDQ